MAKHASNQIGRFGGFIASLPADAGEEAKGARVQRPGRNRYIAALDGLRAFAVLAVIFYHMGLGWAPGGLVGVTVFFVISGYLINGLLVAEHDRTGTISLKRFWLRRARRLLPAILTAIAGTIALCAVFNHVLLGKLRPDLVPSLLFFNNWWQIFGDVSYFDQAGAASPLKHYWSLSIEEQFYVVWPLLLLLLYRMGLKKRGIRRVALVLAVASAMEMFLLYDPHNPDPSRMYYGTDTRAQSLLAGVWLALAVPSAAFGNPKLGAKLRKRRGAWVAVNLAGLFAVATLAHFVVRTNGYDAFSYRGGIAAASAVSALLIAVLVIPGTWVARFFQLKPLVWVGKRSYGMYLWHFPILLLTTDVNSTMGTPIWMRFVQLALIFAVSALSYTVVENPIRTGAVGTWLMAWRARRAEAKAGTQVVAKEGAEALPAEAASATRHEEPQVAAKHGKPQPAPVPQQDAKPATATSAKKLPRVTAPRFWAAACVLAVVVGFAGWGLTAIPPGSTGALVQGDPVAGAKAWAQSAGIVPPDPVPLDEALEPFEEALAAPAQAGIEAARAANAAAAAAAQARLQARYDETFKTPHANAAGEPIYAPLLIGDSVSLGAQGAFYDIFPNGHLDSVVSRHVWENPYASYRDAGQVGEYVVFCLGTNDAVVDWQIDDELLGPVEKDKKIILVNTRSPRDWCPSTNAALEAAPERNPNIVAVVDWYGASAGHDEYFGGDGTHLTNEGAYAYVWLIFDAIVDNMRAEDAAARAAASAANAAASSAAASSPDAASSAAASSPDAASSSTGK